MKRKHVLVNGSIHGQWTVIDGSHYVALCRCSCGRERRVRSESVSAGYSTKCSSCRAMEPKSTKRKKVPELSTSDYQHLNWKVINAIKRCTDPSHRAYHGYGGRGIRVCPEWLDDPALFIRHLMGLEGCFDRDLVLDREDNYGNYQPGNLRFVTRSVSQMNRRRFRRSRAPTQPKGLRAAPLPINPAGFSDGPGSAIPEQK